MSRRLNCRSRHTYPLTSRYLCSIVAVHWKSAPKRCTCLDVMSYNDNPLHKHIPKIPNLNLIRFCSNNLHLETSTTSLQQDPLRPPVPSSKDPLDPTCCATWHLFQPWPRQPSWAVPFIPTHDSWFARVMPFKAWHRIPAQHPNQPTNDYFAPKARVWDLQAQHLALHGQPQKLIRFKDLQKIPANTSYDGVSTCIKNQQHSRAIIVVL